ncbi:hypothetical protein HYU92_02535 [Candidatus Curtissbacteria bacterium]|nr:hypothetical protein [Candidatus Curtissbacteria bacterium]
MVELKNEQVVTITSTSPFDFDSTIYKPAHFPSNDMRWEGGKRWQTMFWHDERLGLIIENKGTVKKPKILLHIYSRKELSKEFISSIGDEMGLRFNLELDLKNFYQAVKNDPLLKPIIKRFYGMRPMHHGSLYEYLIISILLQNATVRRSVSMMQSLFEHYGTLLEYGSQKLWCFWEPAALAQVLEAELRGLKVGYRAKSLIRISQTFANNEINELELRKKSNEDLEKELLKLYGVGPASTHIIMFEVFNRMDYLKHISPWEQKIYTKLFFNKDYEKELVPVNEMIRFFAQRWGKWENLAINYVWEDLWWERRNEHIPWLERLIRL